ncbi:hypothetical protein [Zavarzinella formosa]|uniref:hypothetical protein n=1 Tax=Zavarzinella formosa TaxID=360055 RepID=UPI000305813E|nr:hypothetical protein [Zavarzinella formosa]
MYRTNLSNAKEFTMIEQEASEEKVKAMLRDIAYVLHVTKRVKKEILEDLAGVSSHEARDLNKPKGLMNFSGGAA